MDAQKVDMYIMANQKYFPEDKIVYLKEKLLAMPDEKFALISSTQLKSPTTLLVISLFLGTLGVDRFMLGNTGLGVLKLLTLGCCGILTIIDWCTVMKRTREYNFNKMATII